MHMTYHIPDDMIPGAVERLNEAARSDGGREEDDESDQTDESDESDDS